MMQTTNNIVEAAIRDGHGLKVDMDQGVFDLYGKDLMDEWEAMAPGEAFKIIAVLVN